MLDAALRQSRQGRGVPAPPRAPHGPRRCWKDRRAGARRSHARSRSLVTRPATLSHARRGRSPHQPSSPDAALRRAQARATCAASACAARRRAHDALRRPLRPAPHGAPRRAAAAPAPLEAYCRANGFDEALVGGFYERPDGTPLGELRTRRRRAPPRPVRRAVDDDAGLRAHRRRRVRDRPPRRAARRAARRPAAGRPAAGARRRRRAPRRRRRGLLGRLATSSTPTSPPAATRARRSAITRAASCSRVACDGRADDEAGLTLGELAEAMAALGAARR